MSYHEIRVCPVVRYVVTEFKCDDDYSVHSGKALGEFDDVGSANRVAEALATDGVIVEPARSLRIHWLRGPGEPKEASRWELSEA